MRGALAVFACVVLAIAVSGCGGGSDRQSPAAASSSAVRQADRTHEYRSPPPRAETVTTGAPTAVTAIRAFATAYINWSADTVSGQMRALARQSIGQARSAVAMAAAQTANDYELRRGGVSNRGTVEAVAPWLGHHDQYVVVTREATAAIDTTVYQGLRPAWHVAFATVKRRSNGQWVLSGWQPEN